MSQFSFRACIPTLLILLGIQSIVCVTQAAALEGAEKGAVYDSDPKHLWNRLHAALHVTLDQDETGDTYHQVGLDELDPLPHYHGQHLLQEPAHREVIALLDEFLAEDGEKLIQDAFKRACLQRDLWVLFDWSAGPVWERPNDEKQQMLPERRALQRRLAKIIGRLSLSAEEIKALPDNYAATVDAKTYPAAFDPALEQTPFLPPDLWEPAGPWVLLGDRTEKPLARKHLEFFGGRSVFLVFLRLPEGREQTIKYLETLRAWVNSDRKGELPQFPILTQVVLVRQTLLHSDQGKIAVSPLTESVQLRVYRRIDDEVLFRNKPKPQNQFEFKSRRRDLLAGKPILDAVGGLEAGRAFVLRMGGDIGGGSEHVFATCKSCHRESGIMSVNSYTGFRSNEYRNLVATSRDREESRMVDWKQSQSSWELLRGLK